MRKLRHNDIVMEKNHNGYTFYARVWRLVDSETVEIINSKGEVYIFLMDDLERIDYKGYWDKRKYDSQLPDPWYPENLGFWHQFIFIPMPTLRKLKVRAWWYHPHVLPKRKPRR